LGFKQAEHGLAACLRILIGRSQVAANLGVVSAVSGVLAERQFAKPDVMVRDGHEIERDLELAAKAAREDNAVAPAIAIRHAGIIAVAEAVGVEGPARMNVKVAEIGVAQGIGCRHRSQRCLLLGTLGSPPGIGQGRNKREK
jgi:hypothetical protein